MGSPQTTKPALTPFEQWKVTVEAARGFEFPITWSQDSIAGREKNEGLHKLSHSKSTKQTSRGTVGAKHGMGYNTLASIQIINPNGNQTFIAKGAFLRTGDFHAEDKAIQTLLKGDTSHFKGSTVQLVVETTPCPACRLKLNSFARKIGAVRLDVYLPSRESPLEKSSLQSVNKKPRTPTSKTVSTTALLSKTPVLSMEMDYQKSYKGPKATSANQKKKKIRDRLRKIKNAEKEEAIELKRKKKSPKPQKTTQGKSTDLKANQQEVLGKKKRSNVKEAPTQKSRLTSNRRTSRTPESKQRQQNSTGKTKSARSATPQVATGAALLAQFAVDIMALAISSKEKQRAKTAFDKIMVDVNQYRDDGYTVSLQLVLLEPDDNLKALYASQMQSAPNPMIFSHWAMAWSKNSDELRSVTSMKYEKPSHSRDTDQKWRNKRHAPPDFRFVTYPARIFHSTPVSPYSGNLTGLYRPVRYIDLDHNIDQYLKRELVMTLSGKGTLFIICHNRPILHGGIPLFMQSVTMSTAKTDYSAQRHTSEFIRQLVELLKPPPHSKWLPILRVQSNSPTKRAHLEPLWFTITFPNFLYKGNFLLSRFQYIMPNDMESPAYLLETFKHEKGKVVWQQAANVQNEMADTMNRIQGFNPQ